MKNQRTLCTTGVFTVMTLCMLPVATSQIFYSVDFDSPLNQVGQPPAVGLGSQTPSSIVFGNPVVVSSFGHLTNQPLLFTAIGYEQIEFTLARQAPGYFIDFDFETHNLNPSLFSFKALFDTPGVEVFYLHGLGHIGVPPANSSYLPGWSDDELHHMHIEVDLTSSMWRLELDDRPAATGVFFSDSGDVESIRLNLSEWYAFTPDDPSVKVAIDNIRIGPLGPDSDGDGVLDFEDSCPNTLPQAIVGAHGCSIDQLVPCEGNGVRWNNHGQYVSAVARATESFISEGIMTRRQANAIISAAARSGCGR